MPAKRHSAEQIVRKLREAEVELARGATVKDACRKLAITEHTYYRWRREYGGAEGRPGQAAEATREGERPAQEDCGGKGAGSFDPEGSCGGKLLSPARRRDAVEHVRRRLGVSERRACRVLKQSRTTQRYVPRQPDDEQVLTERIVNLAREYGRYGYRRVTALLRMEGWLVNHKRVQRIWRREGLKVPKKQPKRARLWLNDGSCIRLRPENKDHVWAYDFVHHRTHDGRAMRLLTIVDEYTRESLAIDVARKLNSEDVLHRLGRLFVHRGIPAHIRSDNGPEFTAEGGSRLAGPARRRHAVHRAGLPMGERLCGELQRQAQRRAAERGDLLHAEGGKGSDREMAPAVRPRTTAQLAGLSTSGTGSGVVETGYASLRRPQQPLVSTVLLG